MITIEQKNKIQNLVLKVKNSALELAYFEGEQNGFFIDEKDIEWIEEKYNKLDDDYMEARVELDNYLETLTKEF